RPARRLGLYPRRREALWLKLPRMLPMTWELIWMLVILKIPVVYLCLVVWWAIRSEPKPAEPAVLRAPVDPEPHPGWRARVGPRRPAAGPHGAPSRRPGRKAARAAVER